MASIGLNFYWREDTVLSRVMQKTAALSLRARRPKTIAAHYKKGGRSKAAALSISRKSLIYHPSSAICLIKSRAVMMPTTVTPSTTGRHCMLWMAKSSAALRSELAGAT